MQLVASNITNDLGRFAINLSNIILTMTLSITLALTALSCGMFAPWSSDSIACFRRSPWTVAAWLMIPEPSSGRCLHTIQTDVRPTSNKFGWPAFDTSMCSAIIAPAGERMS
jgi:hypothetical protein